MTKLLIIFSAIVAFCLYKNDRGNISGDQYKIAAKNEAAAVRERETKPIVCETTLILNNSSNTLYAGLNDSPTQVSPTSKKSAAKPAGAKGATPSAKKTVSAITINMNVVPEMMQFTKTLITVKAGQKVILDFENGDNMQHNLVIIKPGTTEKVGAAADEIARDPKGALKHYVPQMPEVLHATKMLDPEASFSLQFTAPEQPGDYPYLCTFPGHWRMMKGVMKVVK